MGSSKVLGVIRIEVFPLVNPRCDPAVFVLMAAEVYSQTT